MKLSSGLLPLLLLLSFTACLGTLQPLSEADLSDDGIRARIDQRLSEHEDLDLRYVDINVHARIVTVSGMIDSHRDKRLLRIIVTETKGVDQAVINLVVPE